MPGHILITNNLTVQPTDPLNTIKKIYNYPTCLRICEISEQVCGGELELGLPRTCVI